MIDPVNASRELVNAVFDAELVDEPPAAVYYTPRLGRFTSWWLHSPRVPAALKSRRQFVQAMKDLAVAALRSPWRYLGAVVRGLVAALRWWRRWVTVRDYRDAAESSEKLADKVHRDPRADAVPVEGHRRGDRGCGPRGGYCRSCLR